MKVVNLTPHEVRIVDEQGNLIAAIPSSGVARAEQRDIPAGSLELDGSLVPCVRTELGGVELPEPTEEVVFIVSNITVQAAKAIGRSTEDLFFPSGVPLRDANGQIIGVRALAHAGVGMTHFQVY